MPTIGRNSQINLGLETIKLHEQYFEQQEKRIHETLDTLDKLNDLLREFSTFTATLHAGKKSGKLDFTNHKMREIIDHLFREHPELFYGFEHDLYKGWDSDRIERVVAGTEPIVRVRTAKVGQLTTQVQVYYNDQREITDNLKRVVEEHSKHIQSILAKLRTIS